MKTSILSFFSPTAIAMALTLVGCGDDSTSSQDTDDDAGSSSGTAASGDDTATTTTATSGPSSADTSSTGDSPSDTGNPDDDTGTQSPYPELPSVLSITGCGDLDLGPLCSLVQDEAELTANCGGVMYSGAVDEAGAVTLDAAPQTGPGGETIQMSCVGEFANGRLSADCTQSTDGVEATCAFVSDRKILPYVTCLELPPTFENFTVCEGGADQGGTTLGGSCSVIQDGCDFQAECDDGTTLVGTVNREQLSFTQDLVALADAQTPEDGEPAFLQGEVAPHGCTAVLEDGALVGSCGAGRVGRQGMNTSVCDNTGSYVPVPVCDAIGPSNEELLVLDSCDILENGKGGVGGIGQPICLFRQNNCIWEFRCEDNDQLLFSERLQPGDDVAQWALGTGTPCEAGFDGEDLVGNCTVPGEAACNFTNRAPDPGGDECPVLPEEDISARGCGARTEDAFFCRERVQHGCRTMGACQFSARFPDTVIVGDVSYDGAQGAMSFNGIGEFDCSVVEASADDVENDGRATNEWFGQCQTPEGGECISNYDPTTGEGFRGLQLFFGGFPEQYTED